MIKYVIIIAIFFSLRALHAEIIKYDVPGTYIVTPEKYNYGEKIIVDVWGAGGVGDDTSCIGQNYGGGGGGYVKISVNTNNHSFIINVGKGDMNNNGQSSISSDDGTINITVESGKSGKNGGNGGNVINITGGQLLLNGTGQNGIRCVIRCASDAGAGHCEPVSAKIQYGGSGSYGGIGGYINYYHSYETDGSTPGGGGAPWCRYGSYMQPQTCGDYDYPYAQRSKGFGGNGTVIIYYFRNSIRANANNINNIILKPSNNHTAFDICQIPHLYVYFGLGLMGILCTFVSICYCYKMNRLCFKKRDYTYADLYL